MALICELKYKSIQMLYVCFSHGKNNESPTEPDN